MENKLLVSVELLDKSFSTGAIVDNKIEDPSVVSTTGDSSLVSTAGDSSLVSTTGDSIVACTTGSVTITGTVVETNVSTVVVPTASVKSSFLFIKYHKF